MADRVIVMSNGEVAQAGEPLFIYREPANRFVAEFVGRNNIISGELSAISDGQLQVVAPMGTRRSCTSHTFQYECS